MEKPISQLLPHLPPKRASRVSPGVRIHSVNLQSHDVRTRMPFRYGIATMTQVPHLFVRITASFSGQESPGIAADHLPPKWFTKIPDKDTDEEIQEMRRVIANAAHIAQSIESDNVFDFWLELYHRQTAWAAREQLPLLLAHFGTSLIERALIDAFCRHRKLPFSTLLTSNAFGIRWGQIRPELDGYEPKDLLPQKPLSSILVRHTIGLADYLRDTDIPSDQTLLDGLPHSLEACIRFYGLKHFKIKINGHQDLERLRAINALIRSLALDDFAFSIDGNEHFQDVNSFRTFWELLHKDSSMQPFLERLLFVEQPFHRDVALADEIGIGLASWQHAPLIIIDESDCALESLPRALALGYRGTSHKNCKGVFKGIINRATINLRNRNLAHEHYIMTGEDLSNIGPVANHQDLVVQAALGIESVERNGHHYFKGLSEFDDSIQDGALILLPGFYNRHPLGFVRLNIQNGRLDLTQLNHLPFGVDESLLTQGWFR